MADEQKPIGLDKPASAPGLPKKTDTKIHVIPDEFYGASAKHKPVIKKPEPPSGAPAPGTPQSQQSPQAEPVKSKLPIIIIILVVLLLIVGGAAAYYFLIYKKAGPVCGDGTCNASESYESCPKDCEPPPPVCGDGECETSENNFSCPDDCEPPPPECGDRSCDAGETFESCPKDCEPPPPVCGDGKCESNRGETYAECSQDCEPPPPEQAPDSDSDGLTDAEETEIFGSDPNSVNSDNDSFVDLNEVLNLFDPSKPDPAQLADNPGITLYRNETFGIEMFRPASWGVRDIPAERTARFTSPTGENVKVVMYRKSPQESLVDWLQNAPIEGIASISQFEQLINKKGYEQIITSDRRTIFVASDGVVVGLTYDLADELQIRYRVTLSMMANSLQFIAEPALDVSSSEDGGPSLPASGEVEEDAAGTTDENSSVEPAEEG